MVQLKRYGHKNSTDFSKIIVTGGVFTENEKVLNMFNLFYKQSSMKNLNV